MKKMKLLFFAAALVSTGVHVNAQTVDEIINKNIDAMGGKEKLATLKTVRMTGSMSAQGMSISIVMTKSQLTGLRMDIEFNGTSYYQFANAKQGQMFMPGMPEAQDMDAGTLKSFSTSMDIQGALFNYKEKGSAVELVGSEKVDGADTYNLKVTYSSGKIANYYIDKKTNRVVKTASKAIMQDQEMTIETIFADYKQNADGYWFPYSTTSMRGAITFDKIETNIPVDEKIYAN